MQLYNPNVEGPPLSDPYVIWTMRRTGGTTLASLLSVLSEHPGVQHEPFNAERVFGHISQAFLANGDLEQLRSDLMDCLAPRPVIKHCYELTSEAFNRVFLEVTSQLGYRHIVLDRRSEVDRIVSLELAYLTGAWGGEGAKKFYPAIEAGEVVLEPINLKRALGQMELCHTRRQQLAEMTAAPFPAPFVVYFEDVYTDPKEGRALIERLLTFLGIRPEDHTDYNRRVNDALLRRGQNTVRILQAVPDFEKARMRLNESHAPRAQVFAAS